MFSSILCTTSTGEQANIQRYKLHCAQVSPMGVFVFALGFVVVRVRVRIWLRVRVRASTNCMVRVRVRRTYDLFGKAFSTGTCSCSLNVVRGQPRSLFVDYNYLAIRYRW